MKSYIHILLVIVCIIIPIRADDDDQQQVSDFISSLKNLPSTASDIGTGIAQSFGAPLGSEYKKSYAIYNDTPYQLYAAKRPLVYVQGATIVSASGIDQDMLIQPYKNSGVSFYNSQMRFDILVDYDSSMNNNKSSYKSKIDKAAQSSKSGDVTLMIRSEQYQTDPSEKGFHDPYYIRAYMKHGSIGVEFLSQAVTSSAFIGVFYNNSDDQIKLNFVKDSATYNVTLDPHSFNNLESSIKDYSIRPKPGATARNFLFTINSKNTAIPIDSQGFIGTPYTYEIYKGQVNVQGLNLGNFDSIPLDAQGKKSADRIRDINPIPCSFWVRSADQMSADDASSTNKPTYTAEVFPYWLLYKSQDQTFMKQLIQGKVNDTFIVRPQLAEQEAWMYVVVPLSQDKTKIDAFLKRIMDGSITLPKESLTLKESTVTSMDINNHCIIDDTSGSGIKGYFLLADVFLPLGVGSTPLYYSFDASIIGVDELASLISSYLNPALFPSTDKNTSVDQLMTNDLMQYIPLWIKEYQASKTNKAFTAYMQQKGADRLFTNPKDSANRSFNTVGQKVINQLTTGQVSIANYPVLRSAGTNNFTTPPDGFDKVTHVQL